MGCVNSKSSKKLSSKNKQSKINLLKAVETETNHPGLSKVKNKKCTEVYIPLTLVVTVVDFSRSQTIYHLRIKTPAQKSLRRACFQMLEQFGHLEAISVCKNQDRHTEEIQVENDEKTPRSLGLVNGSFVDVRLIVSSIAKLGILGKFFRRHCDDYFTFCD